MEADAWGRYGVADELDASILKGRHDTFEVATSGRRDAAMGLYSL